MNDIQLIAEVKRWLGPEGIEHFREIRDTYGDGEKVAVVFSEVEAGVPASVPIPHPVHFREGMRVRNFLRKITDYKWRDEEYDDRWEEIVLKAIE